jgi:hypothetical protein
MNRWGPILLGAAALALAACGSDRQSPLSMRVIVLNAAQLPDGGKWNDLLGRPLVEVEYAARPGPGAGGRTLYLYDGRSGDCRTVIHAPSNAGDPMLVTWAPCK